MKKLSLLCALSLCASLFGAELDLTVGPEKLASLKSRMTNIEVLPAGANGGIIAAEAGKFSAFQPIQLPNFTTAEGSYEVVIMPVVDMSFFKDAKKVQCLTLLHILWPDKSNWKFGVVLAPGYQIIGACIGDKDKHTSLNAWKKGEKHTLALQWKAGIATALVDGKVVNTGKARPVGSKGPSIVNACGYNNTVFAIQKISFKETK